MFVGREDANPLACASLLRARAVVEACPKGALSQRPGRSLARIGIRLSRVGELEAERLPRAAMSKLSGPDQFDGKLLSLHRTAAGDDRVAADGRVSASFGDTCQP